MESLPFGRRPGLEAGRLRKEKAGQKIALVQRQGFGQAPASSRRAYPALVLVVAALLLVEIDSRADGAQDPTQGEDPMEQNHLPAPSLADLLADTHRHFYRLQQCHAGDRLSPARTADSRPDHDRHAAGDAPTTYLYRSRPCANCDEAFEPTRYDAKYCFSTCRVRASRQPRLAIHAAPKSPGDRPGLS